MDMKDLVLSTLSYLEKSAEEESKKQVSEQDDSSKKESIEQKEKVIIEREPGIDEDEKKRVDAEMFRFLTSLRERILVLFEGLQSPNNRNIEAKIDLILNFLEYQLSIIDNKLEDMAKEDYKNRSYS